MNYKNSATKASIATMHETYASANSGRPAKCQRRQMPDRNKTAARRQTAASQRQKAAGPKRRFPCQRRITGARNRTAARRQRTAGRRQNTGWPEIKKRTLESKE